MKRSGGIAGLGIRSAWTPDNMTMVLGISAAVLWSVALVWWARRPAKRALVLERLDSLESPLPKQDVPRRESLSTPSVAPPASGVVSLPVLSAPTEDEDLTRLAKRQAFTSDAHLRAECIPITIEGSRGPSVETERPGIRAVAAFRTSRSRRLSHEDAFTAVSEGLYALADGMGGHEGGGIASRVAIDSFERAFRERTFAEFDCPVDLPEPARVLVGGVATAHEAVKARSASDPALAEMGTTFIALRVDAASHRYHVAHVGDSRCYRFRNGRLEQLTKDHVTAEWGASGTRTVLTRALGVKGRFTVDLASGAAEPGDAFVLCSDGLYRALDEDAILRVLVTEHDPYAAADAMMRLAEESSRDNVSVVVVRVDARRVESMAVPAGASRQAG